MWNSWCEQLAQRMNAETDRELSDEVKHHHVDLLRMNFHNYYEMGEYGVMLVTLWAYDSQKRYYDADDKADIVADADADAEKNDNMMKMTGVPSDGLRL